MAQIAILASKYAVTLYKGMQVEKLKEREAIGFEEAARRRLGAAHMEAAEEERNKKFIYSRALAVSAASGAGTSDPGMVALFGDLNAEGEYRILSRLYAGEDEAEGLRYRAEIARREGEAARKGAAVTGIVSAISDYMGISGIGYTQYGRTAQMEAWIKQWEKDNPGKKWADLGKTKKSKKAKGK